MSEPEMPPVNVKAIARIALGFVAAAALAIVALTFGPFRDRSGDDATQLARTDASGAAPAAANGKTKDGQGAAAPGGDETASGAAGNTAQHAASGAGTDAGQNPAQAAPQTVSPAFDVARFEPNGESVVAGRATPHAMVELLADDGSGAPPKVVQKGAADAAGLFAFTSGPLPAGRHAFSLQATDAGGGVSRSRQEVRVELAPPRPPLVALVEPDRPTVLLSRPDGQPASATATAQTGAAGSGAADPGGTRAGGAGMPTSGAAPAASAATGQAGGAGKGSSGDAGAAIVASARVVQVEADDGGKLFVVGKARPGATLRLYLNDALLASGVANPQGVVEFAMESLLPDGAYRVRLDEVDPATGKVLSRAEAPWDRRQHAQAGQAGHDRQAAQAVAAGAGAGGKPGQSGGAASAPGQAGGRDDLSGVAAADVVRVPPVRTHVVARGDSLWSISRRTYRLGSRYTTIYDANQDQIADRDLIYPGQVFVLPEQKATTPQR